MNHGRESRCPIVPFTKHTTHSAGLLAVPLTVLKQLPSGNPWQSIGDFLVTSQTSAGCNQHVASWSNPNRWCCAILMMEVSWLILWLVVKKPSWKIWKSMGRMTSHIWWKIKNVPNHQPVLKWTLFCWLKPSPASSPVQGPQYYHGFLTKFHGSWS